MTTPSARTDAHAPKNLVTEDYEYLWTFDNEAPGQLVNVDMDWWRSITNWEPSLADRGRSQCHHCGAYIRYGVILRHVPSGYAIVVGETCADGRFEMATAEFHRLRKAAQLDRQQQRIKTAAYAFLATLEPLARVLLSREAPEAAERFVAEAYEDGFVSDVRRKLWLYGSLSERQVAAIVKVPAKLAQWAAEKAEREAEEAAEAETRQAVPFGTEVITGKILTTKLQDSQFGSTWKILVKDDRGFKVWGTQPKGIYSAEQGDRVTFTANVTRSEDDEFFGFFSRPRKAELLTKSETVPCGDPIEHAHWNCKCPRKAMA